MHIKGDIGIEVDIDTDSEIWVVVKIMVPFKIP